jgi:tetratricopeptide (TPR) repeat protein
MSAPDSAAALSLAGEIHELRGEMSAAIDAYRRAIELNPNLKVAEQRLTHLSAIERQAKAKEEANKLLALRARNGKS